VGKHNEFEDLVFAVGEVRGGVGEGGIGDFEQAVNEFGEQAAGRPDGAACDLVNGAADGGRVGVDVEVGTCAANDGLKGKFIVAGGSNHNEAQTGAGAANGVEQRLDIGGGVDVYDQVFEGLASEHFWEGAGNWQKGGPAIESGEAENADQTFESDGVIGH
jgi:hypothetical protein